MDNPEVFLTLDTQDNGKRQKKTATLQRWETRTPPKIGRWTQVLFYWESLKPECLCCRNWYIVSIWCLTKEKLTIWNIYCNNSFGEDFLLNVLLSYFTFYLKFNFPNTIYFVKLTLFLYCLSIMVPLRYLSETLTNRSICI